MAPVWGNGSGMCLGCVWDCKENRHWGIVFLNIVLKLCRISLQEIPTKLLYIDISILQSGYRSCMLNRKASFHRNNVRRGVSQMKIFIINLLTVTLALMNVNSSFGTTWNNPTTGSWGANSNWFAGVVPTATDDVQVFGFDDEIFTIRIKHANANKVRIVGDTDSTITIDALSGGYDNFHSLSLGDYSATREDGTVFYNNRASLSIDADLTVGGSQLNKKVVFNQYGADSLNPGVWVPKAYLKAKNIIVGRDGSGEFNQYSGPVYGTTDTHFETPVKLLLVESITLGHHQFSSGKYTLHDGSLSSYWIKVGDEGQGQMFQSGGAVYSGHIQIGGDINAQGTTAESFYKMDGGTISGNSIRVGGSSTAGSFYQNGGEITLADLDGDGSQYSDGSLLVWGGIAGNGSKYSLTGIDTRLTADNIYLSSHDGTATFMQDGGIVAVKFLYIGESNGSALGRYELKEGKLAADYLTVYENSSFFQTEGELAVDRGIYNLGFMTNNTVINDAGYFTNKGEIKGHGTYRAERLNNYGFLSPGDEINRTGQMTIDANVNLYEQTAHVDDSHLLFELGGYEQGTEYDFLNITGLTRLGGILEIDFIFDFDPISGSSFHLLHSGQGFIFGTSFSELLLPTFIDGRYLELSYGSNDIFLNILGEQNPVPEPSTILLLGSGLAGLAFYRRKRK